MTTLIHPTAVIHPGAQLHPTVQVGAFLSSTIKYLAKHSNEGLILPEEMDYKTIFRDSQKYLGKVYFKKI